MELCELLKNGTDAIKRHYEKEYEKQADAVRKKKNVQKAGTQIIRRAARRAGFGVSAKFIRQKSGIGKDAAKALAEAINDDGKVDAGELRRIRNRFGEKAPVARLAKFIGNKPLNLFYKAYRRKSVQEAGAQIYREAGSIGNISAQSIYPFLKWGAAVAVAKVVKDGRVTARELRGLKKYGSRAQGVAKSIVERRAILNMLGKWSPFEKEQPAAFGAAIQAYIGAVQR